ncbi:MAG: hypothetical protein K6F32_04795 [Bacilli bacterium]|nr:hypothetical protein [Bacilli bacterium]
MANPFKQIFAKRDERSAENLFSWDGAVPFSKSLLFSVQHMLALFVSNIGPIMVLCASVAASGVEVDPSVLENGIRTSIFLAGIGTLIQLFPLKVFGSRMPIFMGSSFTFLGVMTLIVIAYGFQAAFIATIIGGGLLAIIGIFSKYWIRFIKPIVSAIVVLALGLSLIGVSIEQFVGISDMPSLALDYDWSVGWRYLLVAFVTLISSMVFQSFARGIWKNMSIVVGLAVGYIAALCMPGTIDFSSLQVHSFTDVLDIPRPIFTLLTFSAGDFHLSAVISIAIVFLVSSTETIGTVSLIAENVYGRAPSDKEITGGIASVGLLGALSGAFGGIPMTSYVQSAGIVEQTKVVNRNALVFTPVMLILLSLSPILARLLLTVPNAVLGGLMVNIFGGIAYSGMKMILACPRNTKTATIVGLSLGLGFALTMVPSVTAAKFDNEFLNTLMLILQSPVISMFLISMTLCYALPERINGDKVNN